MGNFNRRSGGGGRNFGGSRGGKRDSGKPQMYSATCAECGGHAQVPFKPTGDKPVFCSDCFDKQKNSSRGGSRDGRFDMPRFGNDRNRDRGNREKFDAVCDECGSDCQVPFKPTAGKPILCDNCFGKNKDRGAKNFGARSGDSGEVLKEIKKLNEKIDTLINLLNPPSSLKTITDKKATKEQKKKPASKNTKATKKTEKKVAKVKKSTSKKASAKKKTTKAKK